MKCIGSTGLTLETDTISPDEVTRRKGIQNLGNVAKVLSELVADIVTRVTYDAWEKIVVGARTEEELAHSVGSLKDVSRLIKRYGIVRSLEPVSRFETYYLHAHKAWESPGHAPISCADIDISLLVDGLRIQSCSLSLVSKNLPFSRAPAA